MTSAGAGKSDKTLEKELQSRRRIRLASICILVLFANFGLMPFTGNTALLTAQIADNHAGRALNETFAGWNIKTKTMGGQQFWTDVQFVGGWRIQRNAATGHHRLIDQRSLRHAWGDLQHCQRMLEQQVANGAVKPNQGAVVIVIHGLIRTSDSMDRLAEYLAEHGDYTAINFVYASTRDIVSQHAADLRHLIEHLGPNVTEINFACHSLGNIVLRHYLSDATDLKTGQQGDSRIGQIVMLGPPNQGSRMARLAKESLAFKLGAGAGGAELACSWEKLESQLAVPDRPFGIIAGGRDVNNYSNPLLAGPDDLLLSVDETRLPGATDFAVMPVYHATMMKQPEVMEATLRFLQHGYFFSETKRCPIGNSGEVEGD